MFGIGKKQKSSKQAASPTDSAQPQSPAENSHSNESGFFSRLINGLSRTRGRLSEGIESLVLGEKAIDADLLDDIETQLLSADVGIEASGQIISHLKQRLGRKQLADPEEFMLALQSELENILKPCEVPLLIQIGRAHV